MAVSVVHATVATLPDEAGAEINRDQWNEGHTVTGLGTMAEQAAADYAALAGATFTGAVTIPSGALTAVTLTDLPVGSAGTPTISPFGSATSGFYWASATNISISVSGTERFRFGSGGRLTNIDGLAIGATIGVPDVILTRLGAGSMGMSTGRFSARQGAAIASANDLTLGTDGNRFQITGTTQINRILHTGWQGGSMVTLHFQGAVTVKHNQTAGSNFQPIFLAGAADFVAGALDQLTLQYDSTDSAWYEISRTVI